MFFKPLISAKNTAPDGGALTIRIGEKILLDIGNFVSVTPRDEQVKISDIFLTHSHLDHIKDLGFFAENIFNVYQRTVNVRGTERTIENIKAHIFNNEIWPDFTRLPEGKKPIMRFLEFREGEDCKIDEYVIKPIPVNHSFGAVGFVVSAGKENVAITGDTAPTEEIWREVNALSGKTTVFIETSFPNRLQDVAEKSMHLTPKNLKGELEKIKRGDADIFIYHIKMSYYDEIVKEIQKIGDPRVRILGQ